MKEYLNKLVLGNFLTRTEAFEAVVKMGTGLVNIPQIAAFLFGVQQRGLTLEELEGFREGMLSLAVPVDLNDFSAMDVCGTGGDGKDTFNISTTAAFVVAGAGQKVAKHGNHGVSSAVGSSTVLEYLGIRFTNDTGYLKSKIEEANICYLHAPLFHPAMRFVAPVRKELGIKTFFNILGPLMNPAKVMYQLTGVSDLNTFDKFVHLFQNSGQQFGVVHALDGYDEISLTGDFVVGTASGKTQYSPEMLGFERAHSIDLAGGATLEDSAKILISILANNATFSQKQAVVANAGLALSISKQISFSEGIDQARESIDSGRAYSCFKKLVG
jgi:anthranilate phosphoribosyltransferase